jgi:restriction endonuclease S subunit
MDPNKKVKVKNRFTKDSHCSSNDVSTCSKFGKVAINNIELTINQQINAVILNKNKMLPLYLGYFIMTKPEVLKTIRKDYINVTNLNSIKIPIPPLNIQQQIIDEITTIEQSGQKVEREIRGYNDEISHLIEKSQIGGERYKFTDLIAEIDIEKLVKIPNNEILTIGKHPVITQEQEFISGYTNEEIGLITDVPLIIFGDHTLSLKYTDFPFFFGADGIKLIKTNDIINSKYFYYLLKSQIQTISSGKYQRHYSLLKEMTFTISSQTNQESVMREIESLESKIIELNLALKNIDTEKEEVVSKYLIL